MSSQTLEDQDKVDAYLEIIEKRILTPIQSKEVRQYCTATLLLLFAAIDGLGKLMDADDAAGSSRRIRSFLEYMGGNYGSCQVKLLKLRHGLVHNAISVESFLSNTSISDEFHLKQVGSAGFIYVNTSAMYEDFVDALNRFRQDLQHNSELLRRAANRLKWVEETLPTGSDFAEWVAPSPAPPVQFIVAK